jgi:hypothetical protein
LLKSLLLGAVVAVGVQGVVAEAPVDSELRLVFNFNFQQTTALL